MAFLELWTQFRATRIVVNQPSHSLVPVSFPQYGNWAIPSNERPSTKDGFVEGSTQFDLQNEPEEIRSVAEYADLGQHDRLGFIVEGFADDQWSHVYSKLDFVLAVRPMDH